MSLSTLQMTPALLDYVRSVGVDEPEVLARLRAETAGMEMARMQIAPEQGQFMRFLVGLMGARRVLEVGVFTGYSSLALALALPPDGQLIALDISKEWTDVARRYWHEAGLDARIELRLGPALESLDALLSDGSRDSFDFAFIDADKVNYEAYFDACLQLVRPGGLIAVDNVLWGGRVLDAGITDSDTLAIREFNKRLKGDRRVELCLLPIADGLLLARRL